MSIDVEIPLTDLKVFEQSVVPAIQIKIKYSLNSDTIPLGIRGSIYSQDNKFISNLTELQPIDVRNNASPQCRESGHISKINHLSKESIDRVPYEHEMIFTLDKRTLDYIEDGRYRTKNHDVTFILYLTLTLFIPSMRIGNFRRHGLSNNTSVVTPSSDGAEESDPNFNILLLYNKEGTKNTLFFNKIVDIKKTLEIPSSDWVNDFQQPLGLGKFLIVELPLYTLDLNSVDDATLNSDQKEFKKRLAKAFELLANIEKDMREGEWGDAVKGCRDAIEPFTKDLTQFIKDMIITTTGLGQRDVENLTRAFDNLFGYASGLHHQITKEHTVASPYIGRKEDAYMNYMITTGMVNALARKFLIVVKKQSPSAL